MNKIEDFDYQILKLSQAFYDNYSKTDYPEILLKQQRAYNCLLIESQYGYFICIPYRSEITHPFAFKFKNTRRSKKHHSGLDYTKIVIINNMDYINDDFALIDKDEYMKTCRYIDTIKEEAAAYVDNYVNHMNHIKRMDEKEFARKYKLSTLGYFHKELGIK